ncbi:class I adenylate-forming enzyme family protein [Kaarinaea lacus]
MFTFNSILNRALVLYGERIAVVDAHRRLSWREFTERVARAASMLHSLGVKPGVRFGIICHNSVRNAELMYAGYWLGAVPVPINYRLAAPEIAYILNDAECRLLAIEDVFFELMQNEELTPWIERSLMVPSAQSEDEKSRYETLLNSVDPQPAFEPGEDDDAVIIYTGGTTGRPKGVRLSHRNIITNALQLSLEMQPSDDDVYLHVAPMFHSAEFLSNPFLLCGAAHVYMPKFSGRAVLQVIQDYRITCTLLTPTMLILIQQVEDFECFDISSLRQIVYGSAPMAAQWIRKTMTRFEGVELIQSYGLTETAPILTTLGMSEHKQAFDTNNDQLFKSVGRPLVGVDMKIVDINIQELPIGEPGEVVVRAPNVAKGYLKQPQVTAQAFRDDWFFTGDIGYLDQRGFLYLLDRKKDMIITGSELVFSLEVESVLCQHPKVSECAVVGVADETYGEALLAAVVPMQGETIAEDELVEFCRGKIGGFKIPRRYVFMDELPKSAMNKVLKTELRRLYG